MEQGPIDDHIEDDDRTLLSSVIDLVEKNIYSSMDSSQIGDIAELDAAIKAAEDCNADIANRQSPAGDLGLLHAAVREKQGELNRLQGIVDEKTEVNNTKWQEFDSHMQAISAAPACPDHPAANMPAMDAYFEESEYSTWFTAQQSSYDEMRDAFTAADAALQEAIDAYDIQKAVRDVQYCDWKSELQAACEAFDTCFQERSDFYTSRVVPRVTEDMNSRIEVKKAGDTMIHQIQFMLGSAPQQETPPIDTSRYQIDFPTLPAKGLCDLSPLDSDEWVPAVRCSSTATWFFGEDGQVCDQVCGDQGLRCDADEMSTMTSSDMVEQKAQELLGVTCVHHSDRSYAGAPFFKSGGGGSCIALSPGARAVCDDNMYAWHRPLCACTAQDNAEPVTGPGKP